MRNFKLKMWFSFCLIGFNLILSSCASKYRFCIVDGKGSFKKSAHYCPQLDNADSKAECVVALDRLDCLRRMQKGTVDFAVLTPEDLVTATNTEVEVLITNELKYTKDNYEYEIVAVVDNSSSIKSRHDLRDSRLCHPGYGYESDWSRILANYFEASVVTQQCNPKLTLTENRIKASSDFFRSACKAGPWVHNPDDDFRLKQKYSNLCDLCDNKRSCSINDKYWGRRGALFCLTDGAGEISWARLDDVQVHFGLAPGGQEANPKHYNFLCPDDTLMALDSKNPCVWVVKPWPIVAARRANAQEVQELVSSLTYDDPTKWKAALYNLIESSHLTLERVQPMEAIESYLDRAKGFLSANSFSGCHPPRTIKICTTSNLENSKCSWLRESAAVYGIEPDLDCVKADNRTHCMQALNLNAADVVVVPNDLVHTAIRDYNLKPLFYETANHDGKYLTVAVTKSTSQIYTLEDLRGKKACFPVYDGVAWTTVMHTLFQNNLIQKCPIVKAIADFFGPSCVPELPNFAPASLKAQCERPISDYGEMGAIHCLTSGQGDVAFINSNSLNHFLESQNENVRNRYKREDFRFICPKDNKSGSFCHLSWAPLGYGMVRKNSTDFWLKDSLDVFLLLDRYFGRNYQSLTTSFSMFGKYDGKSDVLFHDSTIRLRNVPYSKNTDILPRGYDSFLADDIICHGRAGLENVSSRILIGFSLFLLMLRSEI